MQCPFCSSAASSVKDSRCSDVVRRRRFCSKCGEKFTTLEIVVFPKLQVLKNSRVEEFDREILRASIKKSFLQNSAADLEAKVDNVTNLVLKDLNLLCVRKLYSSQIVNSVIKTLVSLDKMAAIRFAFFYKSFPSSQSFLQFVQDIDSQ